MESISLSQEREAQRRAGARVEADDGAGGQGGAKATGADYWIMEVFLGVSA